MSRFTLETGERFRTQEDEQQERYEKRMQGLRKTAWAISKATERIGLSVATFGSTEALGQLGNEIAKAASQEARELLSKDLDNDEVKQFWDAHHAKIVAMDVFRITLKNLPRSKGNEQIKLVIVVDELDRCRPDYALSLLEIIKHFLMSTVFASFLE